jgi:transposase
MSRYDLTDFEWRVIEPLLPNKPRGVPRVDDRRVLNGIFWVLRSGAPWRDLPERYGPRTTCYNRFVRWRKAGVWDRLMDAITVAHDGDIQMIDSTSVRVHQQAATAKRGVQITVSVAPGAEAEVLPPRRYSLRQARRQLPRHDPTRLDAAVAPSL